MHFADNRGVRIGYQVHGQGEPLVLIHGWSNEGRYWSEFGYVPRLSDDFQVVVPDLRGHGESDVPKDRDYADAAFASDVIAVMDELGIDSAHVFGYSLGGWVVFELAANFPSRIRSAIVGGAHPYEEDLSAVRGLAPAEIVQAWDALEAPLSPDSKMRLARMDQEVLVRIAADRVDKADRLRGLDIPFLLVCGTEDWRYQDMRRLAQDIERCTFVSLQGLDHLQAWISVETLLPPVLEFLRAQHS